MYLDQLKGIFNGRTVFYEIQVGILYARLKRFLHFELT